MVKHMLSQGGDVAVKDGRGCTPLHAAARNTSEHAVKITKLLVKHGADVNVKDDDGHAPVYYAQTNPTVNSAEMAKRLAEQGAAANVNSNAGMQLPLSVLPARLPRVTAAWYAWQAFHAPSAICPDTVLSFDEHCDYHTNLGGLRDGVVVSAFWCISY
eukprot:TRINITY_DN15913_c0_g1_i2.p2 TRINITY_DN15913_c0_g1~~TRINITY_DN15913_c0_g1_i2.p2  ORF type:complete len:158 (+),score=23.78 TRINITY_DN15913_c0_g1_i2:204-677(+)